LSKDLKYWAWFSSLVKITPRRRLKLLKHFGEPALLWECPEAELRKLPFCTPKTVEAVLDGRLRNNAAGILEAVCIYGADIIPITDERYPELLKNIPDPPLALYCRGKLQKEEACVAVVGSRRATCYGLDMAKRLSGDLAKQGVTIVSGMARGIDSKAHLGALESGGRTIAVLGCGVDVIYPFENRDLMNRICESGAVISEYVPGTQPIPANFPARNRIISGLSQGVAIIEAGEKSGSLITADFALDQGREVFAVPGNINSRNSCGTNKLIREGARLVTDAADILEELGICRPGDGKRAVLWNRLQGTGTKQFPEPLFGKEERTISQRLLEGPAHIDGIARDCGISVQLVSSVLVMLELSGFVEQLPGKYYKLAE
jgi:DNA processing protein